MLTIKTKSSYMLCYYVYLKAVKIQLSRWLHFCIQSTKKCAPFETWYLKACYF